VVNWICGETRGKVTSGAEFFRDSGKGLIAGLIADMLWTQGVAPERKTLKQLRRALVRPDGETLRFSKNDRDPGATKFPKRARYHPPGN
jgi:hypothetical protein